MQPLEGAQVDLGKAQVIDSVPKVIKELKFGVMYAGHSHTLVAKACRRLDG